MAGSASREVTDDRYSGEAGVRAFDISPDLAVHIERGETAVVLGPAWTSMLVGKQFPFSDEDLVGAAINWYRANHNSPDADWVSLGRRLLAQPSARRVPFVAAELVDRLGGPDSTDFARWIQDCWRRP